MTKTVDKKKKRIGFDIDGVLLDHKKARTMLARKMGYLDVTEKMSAEEVRALVSPKNHKKIQGLEYGKLTLKAPAMKGAKTVFQKAIKKFDVYVVSARHSGSNRAYALKMLKKYFDIPKEKVHFVVHNFQKGYVAKRLGLKVFVDDNQRSFYMMPKNVKKILFDEYQKKLVVRKKDGIISVNAHRELLKLLGMEIRR